jgi:DNA-directed RNA polymerase specialized sigma24 family protein
MTRNEVTSGMNRALTIGTNSTDPGAGTETENACLAAPHSGPTNCDHRTPVSADACGQRRRYHEGGSGLTPTVFNTLLLQLDADRDIAGQKYERIRAKLLKFFECRGCTEPEDLTDETINRVAARIEAGTQLWCSDPCAYFYGVARFVAREHQRVLARRPISLDCLGGIGRHRDLLIDTDQHAESVTLEEQLEYLDLALESLGPRARRLVLAYYEGETGTTIKNRAMLADSLGIHTSALRTCVHRIRERVRARFDQLRARDQ